MSQPPSMRLWIGRAETAKYLKTGRLLLRTFGGGRGRMDSARQEQAPAVRRGSGSRVQDQRLLVAFP
jgi:hypothetical protein